MSVMRHIDDNLDGLTSDLQSLIRQPSVSATGRGIRRCALLVSNMLEKSGIPSKILYLNKGVAPVVYGHIKSKSNPDRTLMFYNHYDVQPAEPLDMWEHRPFGGEQVGNYIYGRGASDDKGELVTRIKAVEAFLKATGDVPCSIKFLVEGQEEIGSPDIEGYIGKYRPMLDCDGVVWEFGYVNADDIPIIGLGMKGLLYVELSVREASCDLHSSLAAIVRNPAWRLVEAIRTLRDPTGRILVSGWYDEVTPLTAGEKRLVSREPFAVRSFKKEFGIRQFVDNMDGSRAKMELVTGATCNIAGFHSGYDGPGAKTILPATATAKIDFRLVPSMIPSRQAARLQKHLKSNGFGDVRVRICHSQQAARIDPDSVLVRCVRDAADKIFGRSVINVSNAGTGPMHQFTNALHVPCVSFGCTHVYARIHSPDEFVRVDLLHKTTKSIALLMENFAQART